jgi:hypothetical protein
LTPPKNLTGAELFAALTQAPRPFRIVDFPRKDPITGEPLGRVALWVLTQVERISAAAAAEKRVRDLLGTAGDYSQGAADVYENAAAAEILALACRDADDVTKPLFPSAMHVRSVLTVDEVAVLLRMYAEAQTELGPIVSEMSEADVERWIAKLMEAGTAVPLASLVPGALATLALCLARRCSRSPMGSSSPGTPSGAGTRNTSSGVADHG